jgi:hypothetical protein
VNIHAVVEFDTVILDEYGERRLFEKMQTLLDHFYPTLQAVIEDRQRQRERLNHASADLLADLLIDVAAYKVTLPLDTRNTEAVMESLRQLVCDREQQCVDALLELYRFHLDDYAIEALPIENGHWGMDLFNPASMKQFGIHAGGGAAAGGMAGLAVDAMTGGVTLGTGAAIGAAIGALWSSSRTHGKRLADLARGFTELRVNDETLRLLAVRQIELVQALLRRGHASRDKIRIHSKDASKKAWMRLKLPTVLEKAKVNPAWSRLSRPEIATLGSDSSRFAAKDELARIIEVSFSESMVESAST